MREVFRFPRQAVLFTAIVLPLLCPIRAAEPSPANDPKLWTPQQKREFLSTAKVVKTRYISEGITGSKRVTLTDGDFTHDAQFQDVDVWKMTHHSGARTEIDFRDSYRFNIAAYLLDAMLGLGMTPVSVERKLSGERGALTWWVDDVLTTEKKRYLSRTQPPDRQAWNNRMYCVRVFDELIYNVDRNLGNLLITKDWKLWMIDHTRAFRRHKKFHNVKQLGKCDRRFLEAMRRLDYESLSSRLKPHLKDVEIRALLARRDLIVAFFDQEIAAKGDGAVLFDVEEP